jgi:hypothetical protein
MREAQESGVASGDAGSNGDDGANDDEPPVRSWQLPGPVVVLLPDGTEIGGLAIPASAVEGLADNFIFRNKGSYPCPQRRAWT